MQHSLCVQPGTCCSDNCFFSIVINCNISSKSCSKPHENLKTLLCRLVPGGLAESTGLLAVNDEVLEVNGIEVAGKSLDQVTDMMMSTRQIV